MKLLLLNLEFLIVDCNPFVNEFADESIDLLHIDANHDFAHVKNDINNYGDMLVSGGAICFQNGREHGEWDAIEKYVINSGKYENYNFCHEYKCLGSDGKIISL